MTSLVSRRPHVKAARTIRILTRDAAGLTVRIAIGKHSVLDRVERFAADFGHDFSVAILAQADDCGVEHKPSDHVNLNGDKFSCERKGLCRWAPCKHSAGLAALSAAGGM